MTNDFWFIENVLRFRTRIFDLGILREVVGSGRAAKRYLLAVVELGVGGWLALVILLSTKVQIFEFLDFRLLIWTRS